MLVKGAPRSHRRGPYHGTNHLCKVTATQLRKGWVPVAEIYHDDVIKWKHFLRYWPFVMGIRRSSVESPHKGQ